MKSIYSPLIHKGGDNHVSFMLDVLRETLLTKQDGHNWRTLIQEKQSRMSFSFSYFSLLSWFECDHPLLKEKVPRAPKNVRVWLFLLMKREANSQEVSTVRFSLGFGFSDEKRKFQRRKKIFTS